MKVRATATKAKPVSTKPAARRVLSKDHTAHVLQDGLVEFVDRIKIDDQAMVRRTSDGYLVATPRVSRTGIQLYRGSEVGKPHMDVVRVYRSPAEVFHPDSLRSFAYKPVTNDHPPVPVTADNWGTFSRGIVGGEAAVDSEKYVRTPLALMDGGAIKAFEAGKKELSCGYGSRLVWGDGTSPEGEDYDCQQTEIRINHVALVKAARGGPALAVGDAEPDDAEITDGAMATNPVALLTIADMIRNGQVSHDPAFNADKADEAEKVYLGVADDGDTEAEFAYPVVIGGKVSVSGIVAAKDQAKEQGDTSIVGAADALLKLVDHKKEVPTMNMVQKVIDGITVDMSATAAEMHDRSIKAITAERDKLNEELATEKKKREEEKAAKSKDEATIATHVSTIATKDAEIATLKQQATDSALTPDKLDALVADRAIIVAKVKSVLGDAFDPKGKSVADMQKAVVDHALKDKAKGWSADQVSVSFDTLTAGIDLSHVNNTQATDSLRQSFSGGNGTVTNMDQVRDKANKKMEDAWKDAVARRPKPFSLRPQ